MTVSYNVPAQWLERFNNAIVIVRSHDPAILVECSKRLGPERIDYLQLLSPDVDPEVLRELPEPIPLELLVEDVAAQYSLIYRYADLLKTRPMRVRVPVRPGFGKVVKIATAVEFAVILEAGQPDRPAVDEMMAILDTYLHQSTMSAPVEFFQGLLMAYFSDEPTTIWEIQDEDPATSRYVTDDGITVLSKRSAGCVQLSEIDSMKELAALIPAKNAECVSCSFVAHCQGYFKLPDRSYQCRDIVRLLRSIKEAAKDLRKDYDASLGRKG